MKNVSVFSALGVFLLLCMGYIAGLGGQAPVMDLVVKVLFVAAIVSFIAAAIYASYFIKYIDKVRQACTKQGIDVDVSRWDGKISRKGLPFISLEYADKSDKIVLAGTKNATSEGLFTRINDARLPNP